MNLNSNLATDTSVQQLLLFNVEKKLIHPNSSMSNTHTLIHSMNLLKLLHMPLKLISLYKLY